MKITTQIPVGAILRKRGLGDSDKARVYLAARVKAYCEPYVPFRSGTLRNTARVSPGGTQVIYPQPYAHYHYHGVVMAGRAPKHYTDRKIQNNVGGPEWDKRMLEARAEDLERDMAAFVGRKK